MIHDDCTRHNPTNYLPQHHTRPYNTYTPELTSPLPHSTNTNTSLHSTHQTFISHTTLPPTSPNSLFTLTTYNTNPPLHHAPTTTYHTITSIFILFSHHNSFSPTYTLLTYKLPTPPHTKHKLIFRSSYPLITVPYPNHIATPLLQPSSHTTTSSKPPYSIIPYPLSQPHIPNRPSPAT